MLFGAQNCYSCGFKTQSDSLLADSEDFCYIRVLACEILRQDGGSGVNILQFDISIAHFCHLCTDVSLQFCSSVRVEIAVFPHAL